MKRKGHFKKTFAILISTIIGISSLSLNTIPIQAQEREIVGITENSSSKIEISDWIRSFRNFIKGEDRDRAGKEESFYFDDSHLIQDETGTWTYSMQTTQESFITQEQVLDILPKEVTIVFEGQDDLIEIDPSWWDFSEFGQSQYEGEYKIVLHIPTDALPQGEELEDEIAVVVQIKEETKLDDAVFQSSTIYFEGSNLIQDETGRWVYLTQASQEAPLSQEQLQVELPQQVTLEWEDQRCVLAIESTWWDFSAFGSSQYAGEYPILLHIPEQYLPQAEEVSNEIAVVVQITEEMNLEDKVLKEEDISFPHSDFLQDANGVWIYKTKATKEKPLSQEQLLKALPQQVMIAMDGQEHAINLEQSWWDVSTYGQSQYEGEHRIVLNIPPESLPQGYVLNQGIEVLIQFEQAPLISEEQLQTHELKTTVSPRGTTIDVFDYPDNLNVGQFSFNGGGGTIDANKWTGILGGKEDWPLNRKRAMQNLVEPTLVDGYPCLKPNGDPNLVGLSTTGITQATSLAPLFDGSKAIHEVRGAQGLLQVDQQGYFYYNSKQNYAALETTEKGYGKRFKVYDVPRNIFDKNIAGNNLQGQFFPFNPVIYTTKEGKKSIFEDNNGQLENNYTIENRTYHFGMHMSTHFVHENGGYTDTQKTTPVTYEFSGDDDVWVFVDGVLVGDVGGIHDAISLEINFATGDVVVFAQNANGNREQEMKTTLKACYDRAQKSMKWVENNGLFTYENNSYHTLDFYYLERGQGASNMRLKYNLLEVPESSIIKQDQIGQAVPGAEFELKGKQGQEEILLAKGTTNQDGTFILIDARIGHENKILSLKELYEDGFRDLVLKETKIPEGYRGQVEVPLKLVENNETKGVILVNEDPWSTGVYASPKVRTEIPPTAYIYTADAQGEPVTLEEQKQGIVFAVLQKRVDKKKHYDDPNAWFPIYGDREHGWHMLEATGDALDDVILAFKKQIADGYQSQIFSLSANGVMTVEIDDLPGDIQTYYSMLPDDQKSKTEYALGYYYSSSPTIDGVIQENTWRLDSDAILPASQGQNFLRIFATNILVPNIKNGLYVQKVDENGNSLVGAQFSLYTPDQVIEENGEMKPKEGAQAYDTTIVEADGVIENTGSFPSVNHLLKEGTYYLIEDRAPDGYIRNAKATKIIVDSQGVFANAGKEGDGIVVARGVGGVLKSMSQFATVDYINNTLNDIHATMQISDSENLESATWQAGGSPQELHLQYNASNRILQYGAIITAENPEGKIQIQTDTGWSKLNIYQCLDSAQGTEIPDSSSIENLGDRNISNLFSNTVAVIVKNERTNPLSIEKIVEDDHQMTKSQSYTFDVQLGSSQNQTPVTGSYPIKITTKTNGQNPLEQTDQMVQFDDKGHATISLQAGWNDQGQNVSQKVEIINLPLGIQYTITETDVGPFTTKVKSDTQALSHSKTISGVIEKTKQNEFNNSEITFTNIYTHFEFIKVNKDGNPLQDVEFGLYELNCQDPNHSDSQHQQLLNIDVSSGNLIDPSCWTKVGTFQSDQDGKVLLSGLIEGKQYRLVELKAAPGYILAQGQWTIQDNQDHQFGFGPSIGNPPAVKQKEGKYYLHNYKPQELPLTGDRGNTSFMVWGMTLMSFAILIWIVMHQPKATK